MFDLIRVVEGILGESIFLAPAIESIKQYSTALNHVMVELDKFDFKEKVRKVRERKKLKNKRRNRS